MLAQVEVIKLFTYLLADLQADRQNSNEVLEDGCNARSLRST